ncbi:MAG: hypothetical protein KI790_12765, partial [Cyclobacteriaceae bacterium]|nr:hypothetical protein [Cyclobacteriaceae bacterium HetDA_MAG_MS6]
MKRIWVYITAILLFLQLSAQDTTIVQMEYFLDVDPGYGLGESITITNNTVVDANFNIGTDTINLGFHTLYTRALDEHGKWGIPEGRLVYVDQNAGAVVLVDSVEYFIDEDPGYGNGVLLDDPITPAALVNVIDNIPTDTLVTGFHSLLVRVKGQGGGWGIPEQRLIYVDESGAIVQVDTVEFFFDTDPGYGNGGLLGDPITPGAVVDIVDNIMTDTLSTGFHSLYIRPKGEGGLWGIPEGRLVYVDQGGAIVQVDTIEYFFDVDPGYGNGTLLANPITPGVLVNITDAIPTDTLTTGFHTLMVRAKGEGGLWGIPEQRLIYVDQNVSGMVEIDTIEYFFDTDPGYGNGYVIGAPITASTMVNVVDSIPTDTLSIGFHRLFMRGKGVGGGWGIPEQRMVYVDPSGAILANVSELEYFFDTDPGYDQGLSIVISPAEPEPFREVLLAANALPEGEHTVSLRAKNEDGVWGIAETATFSAFGPGRQLDSASLVAIYQLLDGANWTDNTNWLSGNIDNWFGVTVVSDRVDSLQLPDNNLSGIVPKELGYIDELKKIDLSVNALTDTLPSTMSAFNSLQTLLLHDNALSEFESNISTISSLNTVALDSNFFDFGDLEDIASIANLTYSNQAILGDQGGDSLVSYGDSLSIDLVIGGINNQYQWFLDGDTIPSADLSSYILGSFTEFDTGTYFLKVRNTLITDLELTSKNYRAFLSDFEEDSLALVSLYNATDGANWVDNSGWLSSDLSAWNGVTLANSRVSALDLSSNNLTGIVPGDLSFADSLVTINLASNALSDTIPVSFNEFAQLETLDLSENDISSIPALNSLTNLDNLSVEGNKLQFGDLESNIGVTNFSYAPQDSISVSRDTLVESNADVLLSFIVSGVNNTYQWYRDEGSLTGETASSISLPNVVFEDEGDYRLEIENSQVPGLTLTSGILTLGVTSLARDSAALR